MTRDSPGGAGGSGQGEIPSGLPYWSYCPRTWISGGWRVPVWSKYEVCTVFEDYLQFIFCFFSFRQRKFWPVAIASSCSPTGPGRRFQQTDWPSKSPSSMETLNRSQPTREWWDFSQGGGRKHFFVPGVCCEVIQKEAHFCHVSHVNPSTGVTLIIPLLLLLRSTTTPRSRWLTSPTQMAWRSCTSTTTRPARADVSTL